jgi:hypothetical protein
MSSLIASGSSRIVVSINRTVLSILLVDVVVCKEVSDAWLSERLASRIIESRAIICVHCCVTIEIVSLISALHVGHVSLLESLHFDVVVSCKASVHTDVSANLLYLRGIGLQVSHFAYVDTIENVSKQS